jgi:hypothetical protein
LRAATILSGSSLEITAMPYVPSTSCSASMTASSRLPSNASSMRWASVSVSVSETNLWPLASSCFRRTEEFSMIPLCTTAMWPLQSTCGCALHWVGAPWVAQRVCAMPVFPEMGDAASSSSSLEIFPAAFRVSRPLPFITAIPAES